MKKFLLAAFLMLAIVSPSFAIPFTTEYGMGMFDTITVRTPIGGDLSLNLGLDYKAINTVMDFGPSKTVIDGAVYMPLIGVDYKFFQDEALSVSAGTNILFVIPTAEAQYSDDWSGDKGESQEEDMNEQIDDTLKNFSSMVLDVYARTNYAVAADFNVFSTFGFKGIGATLDPDGSEFGLGLHTLYTKIGLAYDFDF